MVVAYQQNCCISSLIRSSPRPLLLFPRVSSLVIKNPRRSSAFQSVARRSHCLACGADTLVAGSLKEDGKSHGIASKKEEEVKDLKSWMHEKGLPPCKVVLKERPSHDGKHSAIHYVAASEDLQSTAGRRYCICRPEFVGCNPRQSSWERDSGTNGFSKLG